MASLAGVVSFGQWGGSGGDPWIYRPSSRITQIIIHHDRSNIKLIIFKDANGYVSGTFGGKNPRDFGSETKITISSPSEYFTTISGTFGNYSGSTTITSLTFTTNVRTYGPFGGTGGEQFSIPISDSVVVGFHGRYGFYLDSLGIYVQPASSNNGSISLGPWGGNGGSAFSFKVASWIKEITIHHGACIFGVAFKDADGRQYGMFGGGAGGTRTTIVINGPSHEYLTSIAGSFGSYQGTTVITSLSFITNVTKYRFGTESGNFFSIPTIEGSFVDGFYGRAGVYLDSMGVFVKPRT